MADDPHAQRQSTFTDPKVNSGNSLVPMLIGGLVLTIVGGLLVVAFVF